MVGETGNRSSRDIADALGFDETHRIIPHNNLRLNKAVDPSHSQSFQVASPSPPATLTRRELPFLLQRNYNQPPRDEENAEKLL